MYIIKKEFSLFIVFHEKYYISICKIDSNKLFLMSVRPKLKIILLEF
jgi:hypothetical protein